MSRKRVIVWVNAVCAATPGILGQLELPHFYAKAIRTPARPALQ